MSDIILTVERLDPRQKVQLSVAEPNECPLCHYSVKPQQLPLAYAFRIGVKREPVVQALFICPRNECERIFLVFYQQDQRVGWRIVSCKPANARVPDQVLALDKISLSYVEIYRQAAQADADGHDEIAGMGYRKALEFLVKDYLIRENPQKEGDIRKSMLGPCIKNYVTDTNLKKAAMRATWLGNDETHYERRWNSHDITHLKELIHLAGYWIASNETMRKYESEMPDPDNKQS